MGGYSSPLLDQYNRDGIITPGLQTALGIVRQKLPQFQFGGQAPPDGQSPATPALRAPGSTPDVPKFTMPGQAQPGADQGAPLPAMSAQPARFPSVPNPPAQQTPHQQELTRLTTGDTGKSGIDQIHNPWLRTPLKVLDAIGTGFFPRLAMGVPGTMLHHNLLVNQSKGLVDFDQKQLNEQAANEHIGAEANELGARAGHEQAEADALKNPKPKEEMEGKTIETSDGIFQWNPATHAYDTRVGDAPGKTTGSVHVLPDGTVISVNHDAKSGESTAQVLYKGDSKIPTEVKQLEIGGKPHQVLINAQTGATVKDLGETGEKPPTVNVNAGASALDRESTHYGAGHQKAVDAANAQLEKIGEAKAMLTTGNAESQALAVPKVLTALVGGQGTGVRITTPELNAIAQARGIKGDFQAFLQKASSGKKLTPEQATQLSGVLDDAAGRLIQKRQIANDALNAINGAKTREEMIQHDKEARDKLAEFENGGRDAMVTVQIPGHAPGQIHASQKAAFLQKYPNAQDANGKPLR